ncbi:hypothetical protein JQK62_21695, partial [Leptospira santarosai]|nr:hypothetical protein [Leptospira santarosai]
MDEEAAIEIMTDTSKISKLDEKIPPKEEKTKAQLAREQDMKELGELQEKIEVYIKEKGLSTKLETALTGKGLVLKLKKVFFTFRQRR